MKDWLPLVGVVIAQVVILALFWLKQRSDDKRRWHEKRLDAYIDFIAMTRQVLDERLRDGDKLEAWYDELLSVQLLASEPVRMAAERVDVAVSKMAEAMLLSEIEHGEGATNLEQAGDSTTEADAARTAMQEVLAFGGQVRIVLVDFEHAIRAELGIARSRRPHGKRDILNFPA